MVMQRKVAILQSANRHFATHGFRGASLRDIARDAEVSLTLLNHHFGSKFDLLCAVIDAHRDVLDQRVEMFRRYVRPGQDPAAFEALMREWTEAVYRNASDSDGLTFLRLLVRVIGDPEAEAADVVRGRLEDAAQAFIDAMICLFPGTNRRAAALAYLASTAALMRYVTTPNRLAQAIGDEAREVLDGERARLLKLLIAGARAALLD